MSLGNHSPVFKALADPTRRALFEVLCREGERTVGQLTQGAGISQPVVSKHLAMLKQAGLVEDRRDGRNSLFKAQPLALVSVIDWSREMTGFWQSRFNDLDDLLNRMDQ